MNLLAEVVPLQIMFTSGHSFVIYVTKDMSRRLIQDWLAGNLSPLCSITCQRFGTTCAFKTSEIVLISEAATDPLADQQQRIQPYGKSGRN